MLHLQVEMCIYCPYECMCTVWGEGMMVKLNIANVPSYFSLSFVSPRMKILQRKLHENLAKPSCMDTTES